LVFNCLSDVFPLLVLVFADHALEDLGRGFLEEILHLSLSGLKNLTEASLSFIAEGCPSLVLLDLRFCDPSLFESPSLVDVMESCRDLDTVLVCFNDAKGLRRLAADPGVDAEGDLEVDLEQDAAGDSDVEEREVVQSPGVSIPAGKFQALRAFYDASTHNTRREYVVLGVRPTNAAAAGAGSTDHFVSTFEFHWDRSFTPGNSFSPRPRLPASAEGLWPLSFWTRL
jgi:hypothetical protein